MFSVVLAAVLINAAVCDELVSVVVIYRHGDRTPIQPYPTDPYRNASYWPVGFGQLTNLGKTRQYHLGQWLRQRYANFLPSRYSEKDFYIRSTDVDRTLMSAAANLAGLYPPKYDQVWNTALPWQPIPIHSILEEEDNLLAMKKKCPKYKFLIEQLFATDYFVNISHHNHDLYDFLTKQTGTSVNSLKTLKTIYSTLFIESSSNLTLPAWTKAVYPEKLQPWAELSFATPTYTPELARLKSGPLLNEIVEYFLNATRNATDFRKFLVFSAHDSTIANFLNTIGAFEYHCPPYASTLMIELRRSAASFYVNIFYKNSTVVQNITLKGCDFNCVFGDFVANLVPVLITREEWDVECELGWWWYYKFHLINLQYVTYLSAALGFIIFSSCLIWRCCKKVPKGGITMYTQLPSDEVA